MSVHFHVTRNLRLYLLWKEGEICTHPSWSCGNSAGPHTHAHTCSPTHKGVSSTVYCCHEWLRDEFLRNLGSVWILWRFFFLFFFFFFLSCQNKTETVAGAFLLKKLTHTSVYQNSFSGVRKSNKRKSVGRRRCGDSSRHACRIFSSVQSLYRISCRFSAWKW